MNSAVRNSDARSSLTFCHPALLLQSPQTPTSPQLDPAPKAAHLLASWNHELRLSLSDQLGSSPRPLRPELGPIILWSEALTLGSDPRTTSRICGVLVQASYSSYIFCQVRESTPKCISGIRAQNTQSQVINPPVGGVDQKRNLLETEKVLGSIASI